ncbi:MAG: glycosyltransferase [Acidimicrobiales bacterium]
MTATGLPEDEVSPLAADPESPLVVVVVGTDFHPFDRLVDWVDEWCAKAPSNTSCFVQYGRSRPPRVAKGSPYLTHDELQAVMRRATAVVCHGGPATILEARRSGHLPVCVARDPARNEHVDRHQIDFVARLSKDGWLRAASSKESFVEQLEAALSTRPHLLEATEHIGSPETSALPGAVAIFAGVVDELLARGNARAFRRPWLRARQPPAIREP